MSFYDYEGGGGGAAGTGAKYIAYDPIKDRLVASRAIETELNSFYLGSAHKISSGGQAFYVSNLDSGTDFRAVTEGVKDQKEVANRDSTGLFPLNTRERENNLQFTEINGILGTPSTFVAAEDVLNVTAGTSFFGSTVLMENAVISTDYLHILAYAGTDDTGTLIYEQNTTGHTAAAGGSVDLWFDHAFDLLAGDTVFYRILTSATKHGERTLATVRSATGDVAPFITANMRSFTVNSIPYAPSWKAITYAFGDQVVEKGILYHCNTAGAQVGTFTDNIALWTIAGSSVPATDIIPSANSVYDLGSTSFAWDDLYIDGTITSSTYAGTNSVVIGPGGTGGTGTGTGCVLMGHSNGNALTTGLNNVFIGKASGFNVTTGSDNTFVGKDAGRGGVTGDGNVYVGKAAGFHATRSGDDNIAIGRDAGTNVPDTQGIAIGLGAQAGGAGAGWNVSVGGNAATSITTGDQNVTLGYNANVSSGNAIGQFTMGATSISNLRCNDTSISSLSDRRDKTDIKDCPQGLAYLTSLRPVEFTWDYRPEHTVGGHEPIKQGTKEIGFIAQELKESEEKFNAQNVKAVQHYPAEEGEGSLAIDVMEADYGKLLPVIVQAIKELDRKVKELEGKL